MSVNPSLLEGADLLFPAASVFAFEGKASAGGKFEPLRRIGERLAAARLQRFAIERGATLDVAQRVLQELIVAKAAAAKAHDPLEFKSHGPFPYEYVAVLPVFAQMRRSKNKRHVLSAVLSTDADIEANLGMLAWPAPLAKEL